MTQRRSASAERTLASTDDARPAKLTCLRNRRRLKRVRRRKDKLPTPARKTEGIVTKGPKWRTVQTDAVVQDENVYNCGARGLKKKESPGKGESIAELNCLRRLSAAFVFETQTIGSQRRAGKGHKRNNESA